MPEVTFIIPAKDSERLSALHGVSGIEAIQVAHKPFDPRSTDAETQVVQESLVTISYDPAQTTVRQIRDAFHAHRIHILDVQDRE